MVHSCRRSYLRRNSDSHAKVVYRFATSYYVNEIGLPDRTVDRILKRFLDVERARSANLLYYDTEL